MSIPADSAAGNQRGAPGGVRNAKFDLSTNENQENQNS